MLINEYLINFDGGRFKQALSQTRFMTICLECSYLNDAVKGRNYRCHCGSCPDYSLDEAISRELLGIALEAQEELVDPPKKTPEEIMHIAAQKLADQIDKDGMEMARKTK